MTFRLIIRLYKLTFHLIGVEIGVKTMLSVDTAVVLEDDVVGLPLSAEQGRRSKYFTFC